MAKSDTKSTDFKSSMSGLESTLELYLGKKAPQLPEKWREVLVKLAPYLAIIAVVIGVPAFLALLGLGAFVVPLGTIGGVMSGHPFSGISYLLSVAFLGVMVILEALAITGLFGRKAQGWRYMYWGTLVGAVQNVVNFNLGGLVIGTLLSLYLLFQVRSYYK
ncbi:hypothetical protein M1328_02070 [Patescibacteria group bacterium]|nr:hypothetical protein [Patescibacteria group bacterium]